MFVAVLKCMEANKKHGLQKIMLMTYRNMDLTDLIVYGMGRPCEWYLSQLCRFRARVKWPKWADQQILNNNPEKIRRTPEHVRRHRRVHPLGKPTAIFALYLFGKPTAFFKYGSLIYTGKPPGFPNTK